MDKKQKVESSQIAGRHYEPEDYKRQDELSEGLAMTHEQASDDYMEGTIDANFEENVDQSNGSARKGKQ
ncbi:YozQ family protein [uncultured Metabacillus sp.]|uniref:YozQ family protein n=1 Tax=Metabacillus sp. Hm71 TaxID=3450743 RepID=UPI002638A825|nr:YozQ family protein [uncultured Metabacillus sp.]